MGKRKRAQRVRRRRSRGGKGGERERRRPRREEKVAGVVTPVRDSRWDHRCLEMRDVRVSRSGREGWGCEAEAETVEKLVRDLKRRIWCESMERRSARKLAR